MRSGGMGLCGRGLIYLVIVDGYVCGVGSGCVCVVDGMGVCVGGSVRYVTVVTGCGRGDWGTGGTWWVVYTYVAL